MNMNKNPGLWMFLTAGVVLYQLVEMTSGGEAESHTLSFMRIVIMVCGVAGFVGAAIQYSQKKREGD
jgi:hypothetical protein